MPQPFGRVRFIIRTDEADTLHAYALVAFKSSEEQDPDIERFLTTFKVLLGHR